MRRCTDRLSFFLFLIGPLASELRHFASIKLPRWATHFIHLCSEPFSHLAPRVANEINTSLTLETCAECAHDCAGRPIDGKESIKDHIRNVSADICKKLTVLKQLVSESISGQTEW